MKDFLEWVTDNWVVLSSIIGIGIILTPFILKYKFKKGDEKQELPKIVDNTEALTELGRLREDGATLLNNGIRDVKTEEEIKIWWQSVEKWIDVDVKETMQEIHPADAANWVTLGTFPPRQFAGVDNPELNHKLTMLAVRLDWLKDYIDKRTNK